MSSAHAWEETLMTCLTSKPGSAGLAQLTSQAQPPTPVCQLKQEASRNQGKIDFIQSALQCETPPKRGRKDWAGESSVVKTSGCSSGPRFNF